MTAEERYGLGEVVYMPGVTRVVTVEEGVLEAALDEMRAIVTRQHVTDYDPVEDHRETDWLLMDLVGELGPMGREIIEAELQLKMKGFYP